MFSSSLLCVLFLCCSSLLCDAMLKRKRDFDVLSMLEDIESKIQGIDNGRDIAKLNKDEVTQMLHTFDDVDTPFGSLVSSFDFRPKPTDDPVPIRYINPFALLWWLSQLSCEFYKFMCYTLPERVGRMIFYTDEVTPGNDKRADKGRAYYAFFWSILEFPDWFRARSELPYFVFAYVPSKLIADKFSLTRLFKKILYVFFRWMTSIWRRRV